MKRSTDNRRARRKSGLTSNAIMEVWRRMRRTRGLPRGSTGSRTKILLEKSTEARKDERYDSKRSIRR